MVLLVVDGILQIFEVLFKCKRKDLNRIGRAKNNQEDFLLINFAS